MKKTKTYSNVETDKPKNKWFHKYSLRIKKDSVFLDKRAIEAIQNKCSRWNYFQVRTDSVISLNQF